MFKLPVEGLAIGTLVDCLTLGIHIWHLDSIERGERVLQDEEDVLEESQEGEEEEGHFRQDSYSDEAPSLGETWIEDSLRRMFLWLECESNGSIVCKWLEE
jgi:hypothetical protein